MAKLTFKTKKPRSGYIHHESFMTHETKGLYDKLPSDETQKEAHKIVGDTLYQLIKELKTLGYDETRVGFYIHF
ncbi:MAG: hypothetical protein REI96_06210 [Flavobacterium nitrogenifigens]|uniref:hypothetical protein n=1 Tax=Flavobacterium nitrogenifigens TaxID=1617283 RepID=UPI002809C650|nr:hypothetical protein [Flavobacterium nitrogenifigens]MDQ8012020.1 hypothetical protein [Flavobacterium nitrogenifigens]